MHTTEPLTLRDLFALHATDADIKAYEFEDRNGIAWRVRGRASARWAFADAMMQWREASRSD